MFGSRQSGADAKASTLAVYYQAVLADYKRNEQIVLSQLDGIQKQMDQKKKKGGMKDAVESTEEIRRWEEHTWAIEKLLEKLQTDKDKGLTTDIASDMFQKYGENSLTDKGATPWYIVFLHELSSLFNILLLGAAILCLIGYAIQPEGNINNVYLAVVLIVLVFATAILSFMQRSKAASLMADFKNFIPAEALCLRNGAWAKIEARLLVPGDIIKVKGGDNIPADIVLFACNEMKVNNASLTGESEDLIRVVEEKTTNIFESPNVAFFGTMCTAGAGTGVVIKTGDSTVIGRIAGLATSTENLQTTLSAEIEKFTHIITIIAICSGIIFLFFGFFYGYPAVTNIVNAIGIIVACVPEGMLVTVTIALALTAQRMAKKFVLVKNLEAVETLGSTSCICSDKTGTLTQNVMSVSQLYFNKKVVDAQVNWQIYKRLVDIETKKGDQGQPNNVAAPKYDVEDTMFRTLVETVALSTTSFFSFTPSQDQIRAEVAKKLGKSLKSLPQDVDAKLNPDLYAAFQQAKDDLIEEESKLPFTKRKVEGDASETGLVKFVEPLLLGGSTGCFNTGGLQGLRDKHPCAPDIDSDPSLIPFSSDIKFNLIIRDMNPDVKNPTTKVDNMCVYMKGAPERVLGRCTKILVNHQDEPLDDTAMFGVQSANDRFGGMGERVLAFARRELDPEIFTKQPAYPFDVKKWKTWKEVREYDSAITGWFPMWGLTLVGIVSLNDPPRVGVAQSVLTCQKAGIKVIMVTGDQPPTAAAIAHKVNIISDPDLEYNNIRKANPGMSKQEAFDKCRAIVIHGDDLAKVHAREEALDDNEIEKGRRIMEWIGKPEVVFARTTPSQKLLIVDACQRLGHIVAVTGDGVNDSPAIKKANIGVAMGSGSDVAQNAADMVLLNDDFSAIVNGVLEGRTLFENLKKSICFTISHNIPELAGFLAFIVVQVPLPLSAILALCIDLGADLWPAITFAYEYPETDIMERPPRNPKRDFLVSKKMFVSSYVLIGPTEAFAAFLAYFMVMNDYGFRPGTLLGLGTEKGYYPNDNDVYDPNLPNMGNTNFGNPDFYSLLDWTSPADGHVDARLFFASRGANAWSACRWIEGSAHPGLHWYRNSRVSSHQICYTSESVHYANSAYLTTVICCQWANCLINKSRVMSLGQQGFKSMHVNSGFVYSFCLMILIQYLPFINIAFASRSIAFPHFFVAGFPWFLWILLFDEMRKLYVRQGLKRMPGGIMLYDTWFAQNTHF